MFYSWWERWGKQVVFLILIVCGFYTAIAVETSVEEKKIRLSVEPCVIEDTLRDQKLCKPYTFITGSGRFASPHNKFLCCPPRRTDGGTEESLP